MMSLAQVEESYKSIPLLMHYFPQIYAYQQQMMAMQQQQQMMQQNEMGGTMDRDGVNGANATREELMQRQQKMKAFFASPEGNAQVTNE